VITYRTFSWERMTDEQRERVTRDLAAHLIDPADVPIEVEIGWDDEHDEFVIPTYRRPFRLDDWTGQLPIRKLRRRRLHSLGGWNPLARGARAWIAGVDITPYLTGPPVLGPDRSPFLNPRQREVLESRAYLRSRGA
jgi:hypothetical protein